MVNVTRLIQVIVSNLIYPLYRDFLGDYSGYFRILILLLFYIVELN